MGGSQSIDGGSRYVGPALAEFLRRQFVSDAVDATAEEGGLCIVQETARQNLELLVPYPCILSVTKPLFDQRRPTIRSRMAANRAEIRLLSGTAPSPKAEMPYAFDYMELPEKGPCTFFTGTPPDACIKLVHKLKQHGVV